MKRTLNTAMLAATLLVSTVASAETEKFTTDNLPSCSRAKNTIIAEAGNGMRRYEKAWSYIREHWDKVPKASQQRINTFLKKMYSINALVGHRGWRTRWHMSTKGKVTKEPLDKFDNYPAPSDAHAAKLLTVILQGHVKTVATLPTCNTWAAAHASKYLGQDAAIAANAAISFLMARATAGDDRALSIMEGLNTLHPDTIPHPDEF